MNLAVVASELTILPVLRALTTLNDVSLVAAWCADESVRGQVANLFPQAEIVADWEEILIKAELDGVVIAGTSSEIIAGVREFSQAGVPLLVLTDVEAGPAKLFDLTPSWQDSATAIRPLILSGVACIAAEAYEEFERAEIGRLWKIEFERHINPVTPTQLSNVDIDRQFLQDAEWICRLGHRDAHNRASEVSDASASGNRTEPYSIYSDVTMRTSGPSPERPAEATISLSGNDVAEAVWILNADADRPGWTLTLRGDHGHIVATSTENAGWQIERPNHEVIAHRENPLVCDAAEQLAEFVVRESGSDRPPQDRFATCVLPAWGDLLQLAQIGAAARRSLARKRTIAIHIEEGTERSQFKSHMTAIGCGALLWTMFSGIAVLALAAVTDPRDREYRTASAAGFVLEVDDFVSNQPELNLDGLHRLSTIAQEWSSTSPVLLVESTGNPEHDSQRLEVVTNQLEQAGVQDSQSRVVARPLTGKWYEIAMWIAWGVVFLPLAVTLAAQVLIFVARPGDSAH